MSADDVPPPVLDMESRRALRDCGVVVVTARPRAYVIPQQGVVWVPLLQLPWRDDRKDLKR